MSKTAVLLFALSLLLAISFQSAAQQRGAAKRTPVVENRAIYGTKTGLSYANPVIGFRFTLPQGMSITEPHYVDVTLMSSIAGSMFASQKLTIKNVVTGSAYPVQFVCTVMKLEPKLSRISGEQVLNDPLFRGPNDPKAKTERLGNNTVAYVDGSTKFVQIRSYAFVRKGYYVSIVIWYQAIADLNILRAALSEADLDWNGK